jgi:hypothetical protein
VGVCRQVVLKENGRGNYFSDHTSAGYLLGAALAAVGLLVSTTDNCIPSLSYRSIFGFHSRLGGDTT